MIDRICAQLREQGDDLRIQGIVKTEKMYLVTLSDKYGNNMDMSPLGFDIESGKEVYVEYDFDSSGIDCIVPEAYRTYRNIVYSQLCENTPDYIVNELGPYGISYAINVIFLEYISDISISQLYDICNYMIFLIAFSCTMEEKSSFTLLMANDAIKSFLRMSNSEKLKRVGEWAEESELYTIYGAVSPMLIALCSTKEQIDKIKALYLSYLQKEYTDSISMAESKGQDIFRKYVSSIIEEETEKWSGLTFDEVLNVLDNDEACDRLKEISFEIFNQAKNTKLYNAFMDDNDDKYKAIKKEVMDVYNQIRDCNRERMSDILSETLLDIAYIYGKSKYESLRLSHERGILFEDNSFDVFGNKITPPDPVLAEICDLTDKFEAQFGYPLMIPVPYGVADDVLEIAKISMRTNTDLLAAYLDKMSEENINPSAVYGYEYIMYKDESTGLKFSDKGFKTSKTCKRCNKQGIIKAELEDCCEKSTIEYCPHCKNWEIIDCISWEVDTDYIFHNTFSWTVDEHHIIYNGIDTGLTLHDKEVKYSKHCDKCGKQGIIYASIDCMCDITEIEYCPHCGFEKDVNYISQDIGNDYIPQSIFNWAIDYSKYTLESEGKYIKIKTNNENTTNPFGSGFVDFKLDDSKLNTPFGIDNPFSDLPKFSDKPFTPAQLTSNKKDKGLKKLWNMFSKDKKQHACKNNTNCNKSTCDKDADFPFGFGSTEEEDDKPVIYLYPEKDTLVNVKLDYTGELTCTYPKYNTGWSVLAKTNGDLINQSDNKEYSYLFWEGKRSSNIDITCGFVVAGSNTEQFLQEKLSYLGLTPREYNEFIVYWLPKMQNNKFNLIYFAEDDYTSKAKLTITPEPDSIQRVFMVYKALDSKVEIPEQKLNRFKRKGFTVIEWGGTEIK